MSVDLSQHTSDRGPNAARDHQSLPLLTAVELHKFFTTAAGIALPALIALFSGLTIFGNAKVASPNSPTNAIQLLHDGVALTAALLAFIGTLLISSEFSTHRAVTTFTLTPKRSRVLAAKLATSWLFGLAAVALLLCFVGLATAIFPNATGAPGNGLSLAIVGQSALLCTLAVAYGIALGALLLRTAPSIIAVFAGPVLVSSILAINGLGLSSLARWLEVGGIISAASQRSLSGSEWTHAAVMVGFWICLPLALGWRRVLRRDL